MQTTSKGPYAGTPLSDRMDTNLYYISAMTWEPACHSPAVWNGVFSASGATAAYSNHELAARIAQRTRPIRLVIEAIDTAIAALTPPIAAEEARIDKARAKGSTDFRELSWNPNAAGEEAEIRHTLRYVKQDLEQMQGARSPGSESSPHEEAEGL